MLTFEYTGERDKLEVHGDREGLLALARALTELAESPEPDHDDLHLMTEEWGGSGLTSIAQGLRNEVAQHVKVHLWPERAP